MLVFMAIFTILSLLSSIGLSIFAILSLTYFLSTSLAYLLNRKVVYRGDASERYGYIRFSVIYYSFLPLNFFFLHLLAPITGLSEITLQWFWVPIAAGLRMTLVRIWVFSK